MNNIKFSVIVPFFNNEEKLDITLKTLEEQIFKNFETIIVDMSGKRKKEDKFSKQLNVKYIPFKTNDINEAKDKGIFESSSEYVIILDFDECLDSLLLYNLSLCADLGDLTKYQYVKYSASKKEYYFTPLFNNIDGKVALKKILKKKCVDKSSLYCINLKYWKNGDFKFKKNDYVILEAINNAKKVNSINCYGVYDFSQENSLLTKNDILLVRNQLEKFNNKEIKKYVVLSLFNKLEQQNDKKLIEIFQREGILNYLASNNVKKTVIRNKIKKILKKIDK